MMRPELESAIDRLLHDAASDQKRVIILDMLWKLARQDWHGVADCAMDLRELRL